VKAKPAPRVVRLRAEAFGGIVQTDDPPALLYVDRDSMRELGHPADARWHGPEHVGALSAPTEVHLTVTRRCDAGCKGCYTDSTARGTDLDTAYWKDVIDRLAAMGVFHLAMGGGESTLRADLFELAAYAREKGLVPNLTTNGLNLTPALAAACRVFGQINVSLDGVGGAYAAVRGFDGFSRALAGLALLAAAGNRPGVNCVVTRTNIDGLEPLVQLADERGLSEIEFLRFKPTGRGRAQYAALAVAPERHRRFMRDLKGWMERYRTPLKIDCSFVPFLCDLQPDPALLARFGVQGCEAGNVLAAVQPEGTFSACSFVAEPAGQAVDMPAAWHTAPQLAAFRGYAERAPEPCRGCEFLAVCRGGCHVVSEHVTGDRFAPDPECPRVIAHRA
jgi:radical SAM protein with 4Fe4S-binding SPASM domain